MPGKRNNSPLGQVIGFVVASIAVVLLVLDRTTDLPVPYGYDGSGFTFLIGTGVALLIAIVVGWQYRGLLLDNLPEINSAMRTPAIDSRPGPGNKYSVTSSTTPTLRNDQ